MLREKLKSSTNQAHEAIENNPRLMKLVAPGLTRDEYVDILKRYYGFFRPLEEAFGESSVGRAEVPDLADRLKTPRLRHDLEALDVTSRELAALPMCTSIPDLDDLESFLGALYVSEGSALGGRLIAKHLQQFSFINSSNQTFFAGDAQEVARRWKEFLDVLSRQPEDEAFETRASETALRMFTLLDEWMRG